MRDPATPKRASASSALPTRGRSPCCICVKACPGYLAHPYEAGPYQAIPQPGAAWCPVSCPRRQPHEYIRGCTAKLLTLFRPASGEVRAEGVTRVPNAVLPPCSAEERPAPARWETWLGHEPGAALPPLRLILIRDNLAGHLTPDLVMWLFQHGILVMCRNLIRTSSCSSIVRTALAG